MLVDPLVQAVKGLCQRPHGRMVYVPCMVVLYGA